MGIAEQIKARRKEMGLTADEVAGRIGINRATLYKYESGKIANMGVDKVKLLADALRVTPEYLMGLTDPGGELYAYLKKKLGREPDIKDLQLVESIIDGIINNLNDYS